MPNWVCNNVYFIAEADTIKKIQEYCSGMDFNAIIPMPETLNISSGTSTALAKLAYYKYVRKSNEDVEAELNSGYMPRDAINKMEELLAKIPVAGYVDDSNPFGQQSDDISYLWKEAFFGDKFKCRADILALGEIAVTNREKYGSEDWYAWCCENWGTKWPASEVTEETNKNGTMLLYTFNTAWSCPIGIAQKILSHLTDENFSMVWEFADEDIGCNCGRIRRDSDGEIDMQSIETEEFALQVWDGISVED